MILRKILIATFVVSSTFAGIADTYMQKCGICHGNDGTTLALGKSKAIKGMDSNELIKNLEEFANGKKESIIIVKTMKNTYLKSVSDEELKELADFVHDM